MNLHYIQDLIIRKLIFASKPLKYSELRDSDIPNDTFNYHLQTLLKQKYLKKDSVGSYILDSKGKQLVENDFKSSSFRENTDFFRIYAHGIILKNSSDRIEILNRTRKKHPFYGDKGIIGSTIKKGEYSKDYLINRFRQQLGITFSKENVLHVGSIRRMTYLPGNQLFSDNLFNIFICKNYSGTIDWSLEGAADIEWVPIEKAIENERCAQTKLQHLVSILENLRNQKNIVPQYVEEEEVVTSIDV